MQGARYNGATTVTPSDTATFSPRLSAFYVGDPGATGTVVVQDAHGNTVTFVGLAAGALIPLACSQIRATGTDATDIVGLF